MSSKLHRGGIAPEPMAWHNVGPMETFAGNAPSKASAAGERDLEAAYQKGFQDGQSAAQKAAAAQLDAMNLRLARTIEEISGFKQRFRHEAEEDVVTLALAIARRVLHRELTMAPDALLGLVKAAFEKLEFREVHRVRVRPEDAAMVQQHLEKMGLPKQIDVIADPGLSRGSAILDSTRGALDMSVDTQLSEIERGFADLVRRA